MQLKQELQVTIASLERIKLDFQEQTDAAESELEAAKAKLSEVGKPVLRPQDVDAINQAICSAFDDLNFENPNDYEFEYSINYNNAIEVDSMIANGHVGDIADEVSNAVLELFRIEENEE